MPKKSAVTVSLAVALALATSTSPAFALGHTRSFQSLPLMQAHPALAVRTSSSLSVARVGIQAPSFQIPSIQVPSIQTSNFQAPSVEASSRFVTPTFGSQNRFGGGLAALFNFFPPQLQQIIANVLGNAGPGGTRLCGLLGIPQCQIGDSTG